MSTTQETVRRWFDETYATRGLEYLRPAEAYPIFIHLLGAKRGETLLDIACGAGLLLKAGRAAGLNASDGTTWTQATANAGFTPRVDLSTVAATMVPGVAPGARALVGNAEKLPYRDAMFDNITCIGSLERMLDREAVLREMQRVAKPGARFCVMVRNSRTLKWKVHAELLGRRNVAGHQDAAGLEQWTELFHDLGFAVHGIHPDQWLRQRMRRAIGISWAAQEGVIAAPLLVPLRYANEFIYVLRMRE